MSLSLFSLLLIFACVSPNFLTRNKKKTQKNTISALHCCCDEDDYAFFFFFFFFFFITAFQTFSLWVFLSLTYSQIFNSKSKSQTPFTALTRRNSLSDFHFFFQLSTASLSLSLSLSLSFSLFLFNYGFFLVFQSLKTILPISPFLFLSWSFHPPKFNSTSTLREKNAAYPLLKWRDYTYSLAGVFFNKMEGVGGGGSGSGLGLPDRSQSQSQLFGVSTPPPPLTVDATIISDSQQVEAASPISSRPPAVPSSLNYEELIRLSGGGGGQMVVDDEEADRSGGGSGGNRWPRQETLALLKIRSEMDSAFRDATLKGPLWDEVSRKLGEMGYKRNAKKCKEKFENVQKYYKRTKEGRGGRQDGKTYKFFTQLEALHNAGNVAPSSSSFTLPLPTTTSVSVGFGISNPTPISSVKISPSSSQTPIGIFSPPLDHFTVRPPPTVAAPMGGVSFSSNTSSASTEDDVNDEDEEMGFDVDLEGEPSSVAGSSRKRRRGVVKGNESRTHKMMMEFFEGLMKQVMEKQEVMQQKFLEAIEKREQDRMVREENWKRQEMARLSQEQERMAQERTISASRDAAIIAFLQKFTGQTIQFPAPQQQQFDVPVSVPMPMPVPVSVPVPLSPVPSQPLQPQTLPQVQNQPPSNTIPLDQPMFQESSQGGDGSSEPISSRWPKQEVLALIKLRGGLESRYQETGPKGPLWEEISAGMIRMGYKRSAKRCKEKWENINKYFKKVKESNKKRREDSKTCPYFNELDALYRKKILSTAASDSGSFSDTTKFEQTPIQNMEMLPSTTDAQPHSSIPQGLSATLFGEGTEEPTSTKPEDIVNELMELQDNLYRPDSNDVDQDDDDENDDYCSDDDDDDLPEEKRDNNIDYKIEFQRRNNVGNSNGVASEFQSMAVVQ